MVKGKAGSVVRKRSAAQAPAQASPAAQRSRLPAAQATPAQASILPAAKAIPAAQASIFPAASYSGKITTVGTSEAFRFDKTLFKQHPEFKQKAEVRAHVIGAGTMLVSLIDNPEMGNEDDPVVSAFLAFLEKDMVKNPNAITPVSADQIARAKALTTNVTVTDDELE